MKSLPDGSRPHGTASRICHAADVEALYLLFLGRPAENARVCEENFGKAVLDVVAAMIASEEFREEVLARFVAKGLLPHDQLCAADLRRVIAAAGETGLAVLTLSDFGPEFHFALDLDPLEDAAFVAAAYRTILAREPDAEGLESYLERLEAGALSKREIVGELLSSEEFRASGRALRMIWDESMPSCDGEATAPFGWRPVLHRIFAAPTIRRIIEECHGPEGGQFIAGLSPTQPGLMLHLGAPPTVGATVELSSRQRRLLIEGWALAREGVADVEIALGGERIGSVHCGLRRMDVAAAFPDWPQAQQSGFAAILLGEDVPPEVRAIQIILRDKTGRTATAELFQSAAAASEEDRFRYEPVATDRAALRRIANGLGQLPTFCVMLAIDPSNSSVEEARLTLASLREQSHPEWWAVAVLRDRGITRVMLRQRLLARSDNVVSLHDQLVEGGEDFPALRERVLDGFAEINEHVEVLIGGGAETLAGMLRRRTGERPAFAIPLEPGEVLTGDALLELAAMSVLDGKAELISSGAEDDEWPLYAIKKDLLQRTDALLDDLVELGPHALAEHCAEKAGIAVHIPLTLCKLGHGSVDEKTQNHAFGWLSETGHDLEPEIRMIRDSGLFDEAYYRTNNPDLTGGLDLVRHFLESGAREGRKPNRMFDPTYYLRKYPDVARGNQNSLVHFIHRGAAEGRRPCWFFDPVFYLQQYEDVARSGANPLRHYLERGEAEGRCPAQLDYQEWCKLYDELSDDDRAAIVTRSTELLLQPLISIGIVVNSGCAVEPVRRTLLSITRQLYPNWELWVGIDPHAAAVRSLIAELADTEKRIALVDLSPGMDRATAANLLLDRMSGAFAAWMGEEDALAETALYLLAEELNRHPDADIIYSDEDRIDSIGRRHEPHFKPDWNPDLFYGWDYIGGLRVFRTALAREAGGLRRGYDGALFYDLALKMTEQTQASRIRHIPFVLYHRRAADSPMVRAEEESSHAANAARHALSEHFLRVGCPDVEIVPGRRPHHHRVVWPLPNPPPRVSLVIPTGGRVELLSQCVAGMLHGTDYANLELILLHNTSTRNEAFPYFEEISADPRVTIVDSKGPFNFSRICNLGVARAKGEVIGLVNDDIHIIEPGWLREMVGHALRPEVGAVGAMLYYPDDTIQHAGVVFGIGGGAEHVQRRLPRGTPGYFGRTLLTQDLSCVTAACLVMRRAVYREVGGLDERLAVDFNDVDLCVNLRSRGYLVVWTPFAELYHMESVTRGHHDTLARLRQLRAETRYIRRKWGPRVFGEDPYFNPNLRHDTDNFEAGGVPRVRKPWRTTGPGADL
jgi:GT2 family glycosyltransferase